MKILKSIVVAASSSVLLLTILAFLLASSPLLLLLLPMALFDRWKFRKAYRTFIRLNDGSFFFIYSNKKRTRPFIENELLPVLPGNMHLVFLEGTVPRSGFDHRLISRMLYEPSVTGKPPWIIRVERNHLVSRSINNEIHNAVNGYPEQLFSLIESLNSQR